MRHIIAISILITLLSCQNKKNSGIGILPPKQDIENLKQTDFVATIENTFYGPKNYIYAPTLALAWNEIQKKLPDIRIVENKDTRDIELLNSTQSNINSLYQSEYKTDVTIDGDKIAASAEFDIELSFKPYLEKIDYPVPFKNSNVEGFGMIDWDIEKARQLDIIYFEDNNNFIFKLTPKEADNELIFIKGLGIEKANSFKKIIEIYNNKKDLGNKEIENEKLHWKYILKEEETFAIPELSFNIEKSFKNILGQSFISRNTEYKITSVKQRNALLLNNKGVKIESEAEVAVAALETEEPVHITKHLILNNTFALIIKHENKSNPYFCALIDNTELMSKR